jgi:Rrf2 family protein
LSRILRISEAASIALHAMVLLANEGDAPLTTGTIAGRLEVSPNHLSKVLQRLAKVGLVEAVRGRGGGYTLGRAPGRVSLKDIYEAIDGPITSKDCLLGKRVCRSKKCILSDLLGNVTREVRDYFADTSLAELADVDLGG